MRVLIGYASRSGSTPDIAKRIASNLHIHGRDVDVRSVDEIADVIVEPYRGITRDRALEDLQLLHLFTRFGTEGSEARHAS